jgi:hypothetical protein
LPRVGHSKAGRLAITVEVILVVLETPLNRFGYDALRRVGLPDLAETGDQMSETVMALLPTWFEDYNEVHLHSGVKFLSPENLFASLLSATKLPVRSNGVDTTSPFFAPFFRRGEK